MEAAAKGADKIVEETRPEYTKAVGADKGKADEVMLDGSAKGEKRKFPYNAVKVIAVHSVAKKLAKDPGASGPSAAPSAAPAAQASTSDAPAAQASTEAAQTLPISAEAANEKTAPDVCDALFGNLSEFD